VIPRDPTERKPNQYAEMLRKPGNFEVHWPEGNCLLFHEEIDTSSGEPDYNAIVTVAKIDES